MIRIHAIMLITLFALLQPVTAGERLTSDLIKQVKLRCLGPALKPGRVSDIAVDPADPNVWYLSFGSGGLWKTTTRGNLWTPIFDDGGSYSLGCIAIDPSNPQVVWLGTGENSSNRSVGYGDGVYKSVDGGRTWQNRGLADSQHIGKILVDPRDSNVVYVAAEGPLWSSGGDRGLYKTTDGGATWQAVLQISKDTGVTDIALDPKNPDIIYAAAYQRRRHVGTLIGGGPESSIYKTVDAGRTWKKADNGLSPADMGRIALAVSPQKPNIVYALVCAGGNKSGFYRSEDRGERWTRQSSYKVVDPQYYGEIYADPHQFDKLFAMDVRVQSSTDGGKSFKPEKWKMHVDNHAMFLDPENKGHMLVGNDGGLYETWDDGKTWRHFTNLPTAQFYRVAAGYSLPFYNVYGGTQDNGSMGGPSRTMNRVGIRTSEWFPTGGADGFQPGVDPEDTDLLYGTTQNGGLFRFNKRSGERKGIRPRGSKDGPKLRWHWDTPLLISPHNPACLFYAGNVVFRSDDRGDTWRAVSGDLTRQLDSENQVLMGRTWGSDAVQKNRFTTALSVSAAFDQSPLEKDLLFVGTDDGLVQITEDGGKHWKKLADFPGIPKWTYVSDICASMYDPNVCYVAFNNYQLGDFKPYLLKSADKGKTWTPMTGNLPDRHVVWSIAEDHINPNLLFVGTEFGLFFTIDRGKRWIRIKSGAPIAQFRDLTIQRRENDLVAATFGRGIYVLDDYTPLRHLNGKTLAKEGVLFPPRHAWIYHERSHVIAAYGNYTTPNPPYGAMLSFYLRDGLDPKGGGKIILNIQDMDGKSIHQMDCPKEAGLHRLTWNFRHRSAGRAEPGEYMVHLQKFVKGKIITLGEPQPLQVRATGEKPPAMK